MRRALASAKPCARSLVLSSGTYFATPPTNFPLAQRTLLGSAVPSRPNSVLIGGLTIAAGAMAARYALQVYDKAQGTAPPDESSNAGGSDSSGRGGDSGSKGGEDGSGSSSSSSSSRSGDDKSASGDKAEGGAADSGSQQQSGSKMWGAEMFAKRFYRGGFEDKMTRREAALILGVRESATPERVRERHRKMLMLNHPDMGGSTFLAEKVRVSNGVFSPGPQPNESMAAESSHQRHLANTPRHILQVNEAKDLLLKGGGK